jgi:hypothetical protein
MQNFKKINTSRPLGTKHTEEVGSNNAYAEEDP